MIVDASVAVKWVLSEPDQDQALTLLSSHQPLLAPSHIELEVTSAILRGFRSGRLNESEAREAEVLWREILQQCGMRLIPWDELRASAMDIAIIARHGFYDCLYAAAAMREGLTLITADQTLFERCKPIWPNISLLTLPATH